MLAMYMSLIEDDRDKIKFENIYYSYRKQMITVANEILRNETLSEDAVQNALLGIAECIKNIQDSNANMLKAYVLTAARNAAINLLKKEKKHEHQRIPLNLANREIGSDVSLDYAEQVRIAISRLPLLYKEVLMLYYVQEMSYGQMAKLLGRKPDALRQQVSRGRKMLNQALQEEGVNIEI